MILVWLFLLLLLHVRLESLVQALRNLWVSMLVVVKMELLLNLLGVSVSISLFVAADSGQRTTIYAATTGTAAGHEGGKSFGGTPAQAGIFVEC